MPETTDRLELPLLTAGQAQKELTHNEALVLLSALVQPVVQAIAPPSVPSSPAPGQCWIVGNSPTGAWAGKAGAIACWTQGGWRFVMPFDSMHAWSVADGVAARRIGGSWTIGAERVSALQIGGVQVVGAQQAAIPAPSGGATVDTEARGAIAAILFALRTHGLIAT